MYYSLAAATGNPVLLDLDEGIIHDISSDRFAIRAAKWGYYLRPRYANLYQPCSKKFWNKLLDGIRNEFRPFDTRFLLTISTDLELRPGDMLFHQVALVLRPDETMVVYDSSELTEFEFTKSKFLKDDYSKAYEIFEVAPADINRHEPVYWDN